MHLNKYKIDFFNKNWKLGIHLLLRTRHFGVNNEWWSSFPSVVFGNPLGLVILGVLKVRPIIRNYKGLKFRATKLGFLHPDTCEKLGWTKTTP